MDRRSTEVIIGSRFPGIGNRIEFGSSEWLPLLAEMSGTGGVRTAFGQLSRAMQRPHRPDLECNLGVPDN